jgi:hypothetical protein
MLGLVSASYGLEAGTMTAFLPLELWRNNKPMKLRFILTVMALILLTACTSQQSNAVMQTVLPTSTSFFTPTVYELLATETATPFPTDIFFPGPTYTVVPTERPDNDKISGTYASEGTNGSGCELKVILEPETQIFEQIGFELFCSGGAPAHNKGLAVGKILMADNIAVYSPGNTFSSDSTCNIVMQFQENQTIVTQIGTYEACGFGHGVFASGVYTLKNSRPPVIGCMYSDPRCNPSDLAP